MLLIVIQYTNNIPLIVQCQAAKHKQNSWLCSNPLATSDLITILWTISFPHNILNERYTFLTGTIKQNSKFLARSLLGTFQFGQKHILGED